MKGLSLFLIFIALFVEIGNAKQRTASDALLLARQHVLKSRSSKQGATAMKMNLAYTATDTSLHADNGLFYVYNKGTNAGYVIISGDDRANAVLGYTDSGNFDINKIPKGLKYWLNHFSKQIKYLINKPETQSSNASSTSSSSSTLNATDSVFNSGTVTVAPLLGETAWDQEAPYNNLCPYMPSTSTRCVTGCVATAMAQVMYYYKWPVTGTGSNSYTTATNKIPLSLNFSETQFDWTDMTPTYGSSSTAVQQNAVATLMYNCGVSVNMDYSYPESSSYATNMASALISNFGYDSNLQIYYRDFYAQSEWMNMIKTELNASRPVLYRGNSTDGGHIFVCDGYDSNNYFHFNWGWSGQDNGFYLLTALNPDYQDVDDYSDGFNDAEDIVTGVQKPSGTTVPSYQLCSYYAPVSNTSTLSRTSAFGVSLKNVYNYGINQFTGSIGVALYSNDTLISLLKSNSNISYAATYGTSKYSFSKVSVPASVANGSYQLYYVYQAANQSVWQIMRGKVGTPNYLNVTVSSSQITFSNSTSESPNLALDTLTIPGGLYQYQTGQFAINITNNGSAEYLSKIGVKLTSLSTGSSQLYTQDADFQAGETKTYYINNTMTLDTGAYQVSVLYDPQNNYTSDAALAVLGNSQIDTIKTVPSGIPNLILTSPISMVNDSAVQKDYVLLNATIQNTGSYYNGAFIAYIYTTTGNYLTSVGYQAADFDTNEQETLTFGGSVNLPTNTQYLMEVWYQDSYGFWIPLTPTTSSELTFKLIDDILTPTNVSTGITPTTISDLNIYPNPAKDVIQFNSLGKVSSVKIYDLQGKLILVKQPQSSGTITIDITDIENGLYLIQINTETGVKIGKFIKVS